MFTTNELLKEFVLGGTRGKASGGRLYIEGDRLINYQTTIAQRHGGMIILNMTKYSPTTSKHQNRLFRGYDDREIIQVDGVPVGAWDLQRYITITN